MYLNNGMYFNAEKRRINIAFSNVDMNNVRKSRSNVVIFRQRLATSKQRLNMFICKKNAEKRRINVAFFNVDIEQR